MASVLRLADFLAVLLEFAPEEGALGVGGALHETLHHVVAELVLGDVDESG